MSGVAAMHVQEHALLVQAANEHQLAELKRQGILPVKAPTANLLPRETIQELVRISNSPEARAAYRQLWADSAELRAGVVATADVETEKMHRLTGGVTTALRGILEVTELTREVQQKVKTLESSVHAVAATTDDMALTSSQVTQLQDAIRRAARRSNMYGKANGVLMGEIKRRYFPEHFRSGRTWKEIPQSKFAECLAWINTYEWR